MKIMIVYPFRNSYFNDESNGSMKLTGAGTIKVEPNIAIIYLGVVTENTNLEEAEKENTLKSQAIINGLYNLNIQKKDIQTSTYSIEPQYDYVDNKQIFKGYKI